MARRARVVDVADLDDADLLERVLARVDIDEYERGAFEHMLEEFGIGASSSTATTRTR